MGLEIGFDWSGTRAAIWRHRQGYLRPVQQIDPVALEQLLGIESQRSVLLENTSRFLRGEPANNALLWGSRGTGKSSLIKAVFNHYTDTPLRLVQVDKQGLEDLPELTDHLSEQPYRFILFCDDLSFDDGDAGYRELKSLLEGSIELPPENVRVYASSNRRHLLPEYMADNQATQVVNTELHYSDAVEEKISLSDRFGLSLSFYSINQQEYLQIVDYLFGTTAGASAELHKLAIQFATGKGVRSGRVARQFFNSMGGRADSLA